MRPLAVTLLLAALHSSSLIWPANCVQAGKLQHMGEQALTRTGRDER